MAEVGDTRGDATAAVLLRWWYLRGTTVVVRHLRTLVKASLAPPPLRPQPPSAPLDPGTVTFTILL